MPTIREIMTHKPELISSEFTVKQASEKMAKLNIGALPVYEKDPNNLVGIITDRDIVTRGIALGKDFNTKVKEVMTKDIHCLSEDVDLSEATKFMKEKKIRRLVVTDKEKNCCGILSLTDVITHVNDANMAFNTLKQVYSK